MVMLGSNPFAGETDKVKDAEYAKLIDKLFSIEKSYYSHPIISSRKFEMIDLDKGNYKYYHISLLNDGYVSTYGRIGKSESTYDSRVKKGIMHQAKAREEYIKVCKSKITKGYKEIT